MLFGCYARLGATPAVSRVPHCGPDGLLSRRRGKPDRALSRASSRKPGITSAVAPPPVPSCLWSFPLVDCGRGPSFSARSVRLQFQNTDVRSRSVLPSANSARNEHLPRGCSSEAEHQLPKLRTRVRFSSPALIIRAGQGRSWPGPAVSKLDGRLVSCHKRATLSSVHAWSRDKWCYRQS